MGVKPNAPTNLAKNEIVSASEIEIKWNDGAAIEDNLPTLAYKIYLDDFSGNNPALVYDTGQGSITNLFTINRLSVGKTYLVSVTAVN